MTTASMTGAEFFTADHTSHDASGAHGWSLQIIEPPVTSYSLTPDEVSMSGETHLTRDVDERRTGEPSLALD